MGDKQILQMMMLDPEECFDLGDFSEHFRCIFRFVGLYSGDHAVLPGMFARDIFEYFRVVAVGFHEECANAVGDDLGLALLEDAIVEDRREAVCDGELLADLLVTAGRTDDDLGSRRNPLIDCVVRSGVTGMQGY